MHAALAVIYHTAFAPELDAAYNASRLAHKNSPHDARNKKDYNIPRSAKLVIAPPAATRM